MQKHIMSLFLIILLFWNFVTFLLMAIDKNKAKNGKWRIRERTLLTCSFFMGSVGIFLGMIVVHHKTKHKKFEILVPISLVENAIIFIWILDKLLAI